MRKYPDREGFGAINKVIVNKKEEAGNILVAFGLHLTTNIESYPNYEVK